MRAVKVEPMPGEEFIASVTGIARVTVKVQEDELFGMLLLESCEKFNVAFGAIRHFFIQHLAFDAQQATECAFPLGIVRMLIRGNTLRKAKEIRARITCGENFDCWATR